MNAAHKHYLIQLLAAEKCQEFPFTSNDFNTLSYAVGSTVVKIFIVLFERM